jgi:hypothetical protein
LLLGRVASRRRCRCRRVRWESRAENCGGGALVFGGCDFGWCFFLRDTQRRCLTRTAASDRSGRSARPGAGVFVQVNHVLSSAGYLEKNFCRTLLPHLFAIIVASTVRHPIKQSCHVEIFPVGSTTGTPLHCSFSMDGRGRRDKAQLTWPQGREWRASNPFFTPDGHAYLLPPLVARCAATVTVQVSTVFFFSFFCI